MAKTSKKKPRPRRTPLPEIKRQKRNPLKAAGVTRVDYKDVPLLPMGPAS